MTVVLVCGGRKYHDRSFVFFVLNKTHRDIGISLLVEGGASGADALAREWAVTYGCPYRTFHAQWRLQGKNAGPSRNARMLKEANPQLVIAFPGGARTADMITQAKAAGVRVWQPEFGELMATEVAVSDERDCELASEIFWGDSVNWYQKAVKAIKLARAEERSRICEKLQALVKELLDDGHSSPT